MQTIIKPGSGQSSTNHVPPLFNVRMIRVDLAGQGGTVTWESRKSWSCIKSTKIQFHQPDGTKFLPEFTFSVLFMYKVYKN